MNFPRRRFLGSSLVILGSSLLDALTTPLWKWNRSLSLSSTQTGSPESPVQFVNVAREAGLTTPNVWGGADHKRYIIEAKGSGLAFFDYDQDGWLDIYLTNGRASMRNGRPVRSRRHISTRTIATGLSPTSRQNPGWRALAGRPAFASVTTITTAGTTCSAASGDTTFSFTTTAMALSAT
jgi:hypothetical protein